MLLATDEAAILIHHPEVLGGYVELVESSHRSLTREWGLLSCGVPNGGRVSKTGNSAEHR
jgi:hypothetical protein